jgi:GLPGLI family protein
MKAITILFISILCFLHSQAQQRIVAECTVNYAITTDSSSEKDMQQSLKSSVKNVYIKGNNCRTDLISPAFTQSVIFDKTNNTAVILREFGNNKFMTKLDAAQWINENKKYQNLSFSVSSEKKTILGYDCKKASIILKDGTNYTIYFATAIVPSVKEFEYEFKDVPGFVMEYQIQDTNGKKVTYLATEISLSPVQTSHFKIPAAGYRMLE